MRQLKLLLRALERENLYPEMKTVEETIYPELVIEGKKYICLCSNNYLGLSVHEEVKRAAIQAIEKYGIGTCESRFISGNLDILEQLEAEIADFKNAPAAMIFVSGYSANVGVIPAIMDSYSLKGFPRVNNNDNLIIGDAYNHTSIMDGVRLSRSNRVVYDHNDMNKLEDILRKNEDKRKLIITDGVFSMDGDYAPLKDIVGLAQKYNAMTMVDDAHATGIIGENGRGTPELFDVEGEIDFVMGTLSKAFGGLGGYITAAEDLIKVLRIKSNSYIFTSSLPAEQAAGIIASINIVKKQPELRRKLWENVAHLKDGLQSMGYQLDSPTQILPIHIGDEKRCIQASKMCFDMGIMAPAVTWPAVPRGEARIRCSVIATHTKDQIDQALDTFRVVGKELALI